MQIDKHKAGNFCWFELATIDQPAAKNFYQSLFGWEASDIPISAGEVYTMLKVDGRDVGAIYTMRPEERSSGGPPHWGLYIAVDNADATTALAASLGAKVLAPPFDVMPAPA